MEECFGQVGREVHLADGQVEIFFCSPEQQTRFELCSSKMPLPSTNLNLTRKSPVAKPKDQNLGL